MKFNSSMFESIKDALNKQKNTKSATKDILTLEKDKTYLVRLLPNVADPENTLLHYYTFGWNSFSTGGYVQAVSPTSWGERDPIAEERIRAYRAGSDTDKEKIKNVKRAEKWLANVYVINDPTNPDNNGKVKLLRFGKQLHNIIDSAINGEDADEFGIKVFDLSPNGVNLKIKVDDQGGYANYTASRFTSSVDLKLSAEQIDKLYESTTELKSVLTVKSYDELKKMLDEHYFANKSAAPATESFASSAPVHNYVQPPAEDSDSPPAFDDDDDAKMRALLEGI